ncbi:glycine cleavage H-protein-domain-containing protein [Phyllosticta citribraziliensis]|uniref:Glycine cleavage system H protein n=1 Tax=Phyllosticta citribraziliensis TaxID=989973 RepID=A0ABR1L6T9_9PEZI
MTCALLVIELLPAETFISPRPNLLPFPRRRAPDKQKMASRSSIVRAARQLSSCSFAHPQRPVVACRAATSWKLSSSARPFSVSAAVRAKKYTEDHEWVELAADGKTFTLGVSAYAANALGDVVYVELPQEDQAYGAHDTIGSVESVKSASDILTPLPGKVVGINKLLEEKPATINKSPEGDGWIAKFELEGDKSQVDALMSEEAYNKFTTEE